MHALETKQTCGPNTIWGVHVLQVLCTHDYTPNLQFWFSLGNGTKDQAMGPLGSIGLNLTREEKQNKGGFGIVIEIW